MVQASRRSIDLCVANSKFVAQMAAISKSCHVDARRYDARMREIAMLLLHQALNMKYQAELYEPSPRPYRGLVELEYPFHDHTITVTQCGRICFGRQKINLSKVFAGQNVGVK